MRVPCATGFRSAPAIVGSQANLRSALPKTPRIKPQQFAGFGTDRHERLQNNRGHFSAKGPWRIKIGTGSKAKSLKATGFPPGSRFSDFPTRPVTASSAGRGRCASLRLATKSAAQARSAVLPDGIVKVHEK
jgi:hypothetical protein